MSFSKAVKSCITKFFDFSGRASRSEFWWFLFFISVIHTLLFNWFSQTSDGLSFHFGFNLVLNTQAPWWANIYTAVCTIPFLSVLVRRAHDVNADGSVILIVPFIAFATFVMFLKLFPTQGAYTALLGLMAVSVLALFFFLTLKKSDPSTNRFGPNPHEVPT